jgi:3-(methylthio)propanoyl-CoA dehydrogenase
MRAATQALLQALATHPDAGMAVAVPYLKLCGYVIGGWLLAKSAAIAAAKLDGADRDFYAAKIRTAAFYAAQVLPTAAALAQVVTAGGASVTETAAALI